MKCTLLYHTLLILGLHLPSTSFTQVQQDTGDLFLEISDIISNIPGHSGNDFALPSAQEADQWGELISNVLNHNFITASNLADGLDYQLVAYYDNAQSHTEYYLLKSNGNNYWGTYIYNPNYCRNLVIQAPHPLKDFNTGKQGAHIFLNTGASFFMMSGTSRCNHSSYSSCSGSTSVCSGSSESYRISDLAHITNSVFQSTTDTLFSRSIDSYFLQCHGFSKQSTDPFIILSNGTRSTPANDYLSDFASNLMNEDALFIDSIKIAHQDLTWNRLIGFTNVQGRLINQSNNTCSSNATNTSGRFIHMEQEKTILRDNVTGWNKVANAVNSTFSCNSYQNIHQPKKTEFTLYPNPANEIISIKSSDSNQLILLRDIYGRQVAPDIRTINSVINLDISQLNSGCYIITVGNMSQKFIKN